MRTGRPPCRFTDAEKAALIEQQFWQSIAPIPEGAGCWEWLGTIKASNGYGWLRRFHKRIYAHRLSWILAFGAVPSGFCVLHKCDNRTCANPAHLFLGTHRDNAVDMHAKNRHSHGPSHSAALRARTRHH